MLYVQSFEFRNFYMYMNSKTSTQKRSHNFVSFSLSKLTLSSLFDLWSSFFFKLQINITSINLSV